MPSFMFRILLVEDQVNLAQDMKEAFSSMFQKRAAPITQLKNYAGNWSYDITLVHTLDEFKNKLCYEYFHFVSIDLKIPINDDSSIVDEPKGLEPFELNHNPTKINTSIIVKAPILAGAIYTQFAKEYMGFIGRAARLEFDFWCKSAYDSDPNADPPVLKVEHWAERVGEWILPYGPMQGRMLRCVANYLPRSLAEICKELNKACAAPNLKHLDNQNNERACQWRINNTYRGLLDMCRLGEICKEWLWVLLAARIANGQSTGILMDEQRKKLGVIAENGWKNADAVEQQNLKEQQLNDWIVLLDEGDGINSRLKQQIGGTRKNAQGNVPLVTALSALRDARNKLAHANPRAGFFQDYWDKLALPFARILDILAYLATFPLLQNVQAVAPNFVKGDILDSSSKKSQKYELSSVWGIKSNNPIDNNTVYTVWPEEKDISVLLDLSPWITKRQNANNNWETYFYMGRSKRNNDVRDLNAYTWLAETVRINQMQNIRSQLLQNPLPNFIQTSITG